MKQFRNTKYFATEDGDIVGPKGKRSFQTNPGGYATINLWYNGRQNFHSVHRVIKEAFHGPSELDIDHGDADKLNNALYNLEYVNDVENCKRKESSADLPYYISRDRNKYRYIRDGKIYITSPDLDKVIEFKTQYENE